MVRIDDRITVAAANWTPLGIREIETDFIFWKSRLHQKHVSFSSKG